MIRRRKKFKMVCLYGDEPILGINSGKARMCAAGSEKPKWSEKIRSRTIENRRSRIPRNRRFAPTAACSLLPTWALGTRFHICSSFRSSRTPFVWGVWRDLRVPSLHTFSSYPVIRAPPLPLLLIPGVFAYESKPVGQTMYFSRFASQRLRFGLR